MTSPSNEPAPAHDVPFVLALVGTDHHPFDRLVSWVDGWAARHPEARVLIQTGTSRMPRVADHRAFLDHGELQDLMHKASAVVSHGGPSTIAECRRRGLLPLVLPRDPALAEHVDAHQMRFVERLQARGLVQQPVDEEGLCALLDEALHDPARLTVDDRQHSHALLQSCHEVENAVMNLLRSGRRRGGRGRGPWNRGARSGRQAPPDAPG